MALSVNWSTKVISIPRSDMTLVQAAPTEIRELNVDTFRLELKDLEDSITGMAYLDVHRHVAPVSVGGVELARVVEIINEYTITFEDGQYAVNLVGANNNIGDRVNVNQVSVRSSNSAGLVTSAAIEFGEYGGGATLDTSNTTGKATTGSTYPVGTLRVPALDISDALILIAAKGFSKMYVIGDIEFTAAHNIDGLIINGVSHVQNEVNILDAASCSNSVFNDIEIFGVLDGDNEVNNCLVNTLTYFSGHIHNSGLKGVITLAGGTPSLISDCKTVDPYSPPTINMGGSGQDLSMPNFSGILTVENLTGDNFAGIGLSGGTLVLADTVSNGTIHVSGIGVLQDTNGDVIQSGDWNGATIINQTVSEDNIANKVWAETNNGQSVMAIITEILQGVVGTVDVVDNGNGTETIKVFDTGDTDPDTDTPLLTMITSNNGLRRIRQ